MRNPSACLVAGFDHADDRAVLARLEFHDGVARGRIGSFQARLGHGAEIAAVARGLGIFGILHRQRGEIVAAVEAIGDHLDFLARLGFVLRLVVLVVRLRVGRRRHHDLGQVILRFDQIEFAFVRVVVVGDVLVGDVDFGRDFFVHHLLDGDGAPDVALEIGQGDFLSLSRLSNSSWVNGRLDFVVFAVDFFVGGQQAEFFGATHHDLVFDHLVQNVQAQRGGLLAGGRLLRRGDWLS